MGAKKKKEEEVIPEPPKEYPSIQLTFFKIDPKSEILELLFEKKKEQLECRFKEDFGALALQKVFRQYRQRKKYWQVKDAVMDIQRTFRGYRYGKKVIQRKRKEEEERRIQYYHNWCATVIQKTWRGYHIRNTEIDFYERKAELDAIHRKGLEMSAYVDKSVSLQKELARQTKILNEEKRFEKIGSKLHHLVSTKSISGIYKPNYRLHSKTTVYNQPIELQLRSIARTKAREQVKKSSLRSRTYRSQNDSSFTFSQTSNQQTNYLPTLDVRDTSRANPNKRLGPFLPQHKLSETLSKVIPPSIVRDRPYEYIEEKEKNEKHLNTLIQIGDKPFVPLRKVSSPKYSGRVT